MIDRRNIKARLAGLQELAGEVQSLRAEEGV